MTPFAVAERLGYTADDLDVLIFTGEGCCIACCATVRGIAPCSGCRIAARHARRPFKGAREIADTISAARRSPGHSNPKE